MGLQIYNTDSSTTYSITFYMRFIETSLKGSYIIKLEKNEDSRGFFVRTFCTKEFEEQNIDFNIVQTSMSYNKKKGTLRGIHYQSAPYEEAKLVQCLKGSIFDVIVDIRQKSSTFNKWFGIILNDHNYDMMYIPKGFAHGYQTLDNDTLVLYYMNQYHFPEYSKTISYDDRDINVNWICPPSIMSEKDLNLSEKVNYLQDS